jgi:hypothetical protein
VVWRRNMMAQQYTQKTVPENRVGLHYNSFPLNFKNHIVFNQ